ncbi:MAG: RNA methyltransferase [Ignavibacteriales bacterium]|nr:RNA methyltransferase [Ignavibacteriales bacterium]
MRKLTHTEIAQKRTKPEEILRAERIPVTVLVDNVRSLYNVGSMFRTSDGAMITKLILTGFTPHPPRKEIEKTALGSTKSVPWEYEKNPLASIGVLKEQGYRICSLELTDSSISYDSVQPSDFPLCLVIGNEITGISREILSQSDMAIEIPMFGIKQSLNVAVAYGIAVFELARIWQRHHTPRRD